MLTYLIWFNPNKILGPKYFFTLYYWINSFKNVKELVQKYIWEVMDYEFKGRLDWVHKNYEEGVAKST